MSNYPVNQDTEREYYDNNFTIRMAIKSNILEVIRQTQKSDELSHPIEINPEQYIYLNRAFPHYQPEEIYCLLATINQSGPVSQIEVSPNQITFYLPDHRAVTIHLESIDQFRHGRIIRGKWYIDASYNLTLVDLPVIFSSEYDVSLTHWFIDLGNKSEAKHYYLKLPEA